MSQAATGESNRIGVLSLHNSKETKAILNAIEALGHEPVWLRDSNLNSSIRSGRVSFEPEVDVIVNRLLLTKIDRPLENLALASMFDEVGSVLNPPQAVLRAMHKYNAATAMADAGIPVPDSFLALSQEEFNRARAQFGRRVVQKRAIGTNGNSMTLVDESDPITPRVVQRRTFLQEYVDTGHPRPFDIRAYVIDGEVVGAMRREAPRGEWRTNVALGGDVEDVTATLPTEATRQARRATSLFGLDYAGVDLIPDPDGGWYVLEVNATGGFKGLYEATGRSVAPYIAQLAIERAGGVVDPERVERLAMEFDDRVPDCRPVRDPTRSRSPTIGFTEEVRVAGRSGVATVVAKADTGASRTSIDTELAAEIGAGPIQGTTVVNSAVSARAKKRPLVDVEIGLSEEWRTVTASMNDRDGLRHQVLIGRDILSNYQVDMQRRVDEE